MIRMGRNENVEDGPLNDPAIKLIMFKLSVKLDLSRTY